MLIIILELITGIDTSRANQAEVMRWLPSSVAVQINRIRSRREVSNPNNNHNDSESSARE